MVLFGLFLLSAFFFSGCESRYKSCWANSVGKGVILTMAQVCAALEHLFKVSRKSKCLWSRITSWSYQELCQNCPAQRSPYCMTHVTDSCICPRPTINPRRKDLTENRTLLDELDIIANEFRRILRILKPYVIWIASQWGAIRGVTIPAGIRQ